MNQAKTSFWEADAFYPHHDLIVLGGGIVGLNAAITARELHPNKSILIIEGGKTPMGASTRNAGFACFGSVSEILADLKKSNLDFVRTIIKNRWDGLAFLKERVPSREMDYERCGAHEVFLKESEIESVKEKVPELNEMMIELIGLPSTYSWVDNEFGIKAHNKMLYNPHEGSLHPGKLIKFLLAEIARKGINYLANSNVEEINENEELISLALNDGKLISGGQLIVATNAFTSKFFPDLDLKPARNQVIVTNEINNLQLKGCYHYLEGYYYFRTIGKRVLLGGARIVDEQAEETDKFGLSDTIQAELKRFMREVVLPKNKWEIAYEWSGIMGVGEAKSPIIKKISPRTTLAVRLGGMGIAIGSWVGTKAAEIAFND